ncbi:MAG: diacylglycerol kinase [Actinobacteria bacterium 13_2_20CM_2_71_6]|nr:MAG: diacylglycerol kinase [Actinobacteria bacterium 13_2_20CM_2_71_6]
MRALLVVNHKATTTSGRVRDVLVQALSNVVHLTVEHTRRRGHAASLAQQAAADGMDVVVTLGGDGTVNEAVNGLLAHGTGPDAPALGVVPGGSTNVFARALGLPSDCVEATGVLLEALRANRFRTIGLGRADDRYFTFCAGLGIDAEVIARVERARGDGGNSTSLQYLRALAGQYFLDTDRRKTRITLEQAAGEADENLATVVVQNTSPWTFLGSRRVDACPDASFDLGLDLLGMRALPFTGTSKAMLRMLFPGGRPGKPGGPHGRRVLRLHNVTEFGLRATEPVAFQLDGDYLGAREKVRFTAVPSALRVFC